MEYKKCFGQNFIHDTNLLKAIVEDAGITPQDDVLEIGVGEGTLTRQLCQKANRVVSYEIDRDLKDRIEKTLYGIENSQIIYKDFLKESLDNLEELFPDGFKVVANLPYYITSPIILKLLQSKKLKSITIMVQKEVAERICAKENTKDYGVLTVTVNSVADSEIKREVNRKMFYPIPNVDSALCQITINRNKYNITNIDIFNKVVNAGFNPRRKMLFANLKSQMNLDSTKLNEIFKELKLDTKIRGEVLSVEQFVMLAEKILENSEK